MKKKKREKKAFTLIELLAVIIILSIISLIVGVVIGNVINNARKETYKESVRGMIRAGENYAAKYALETRSEIPYPLEFRCDGTECSFEEHKLEFNGEVPKSGAIILLDHKTVKASYISNGKYCVVGTKNNLQVAKSCTDIDDTIPRIAGVQEGNILHLTLIDNESGIDAYCVNTVNNSTSCNWVSTTNSSVDHELSLSGTYYAFARDKKNNISESIEFVTGDIEKPIVTATIDGKVISISLSDNASVANWCIVNTNSYAECNWQIPESNTFSHVLSEAGTYYIFAKDTAGNISDSVEVVAPVDVFCSFEIGHVWNDFAAGASSSWTVPCNGTYKLEVWGAQGGGTNTTPLTSVYAQGGKGGYSSGNKEFTKDTIIYVTIGKQGPLSPSWGTPTSYGGYNGGGNGYGGYDASQIWGGFGGGGATHIAKVSGTLASIGYESFVTNGNGLIVAGGGAGGLYDKGTPVNYSYVGGYGGGETGGQAKSGNGSWTAGTPATQTTGYAFGQGANGAYSYGGMQGGGGGGFYGGYVDAGGSGWIGGVTDGTLIAGNASMPTHDGASTMTGNSGDGYAKITLISY